MDQLSTFNMGQHLIRAEKILAEAGVDSPRLDAEILLAHVLGRERADLYLSDKGPLPSKQAAQFESLIKRRAAREPVAYIIGYKEFWSLKIPVTPAVLIPRPETEGIVELAIKSFEIQAARDAAWSVLDLGTGSGCIAAALACEWPNAEFMVSDISAGALDVAKKTLAFAALRIEFRQGDLFSAIDPGRRFDLICCNPPYIADDEYKALAPEITHYEPPLALKAGPDGLAISVRIIKDAPQYMRDGGLLIMEMGINQAERLANFARQSGQYKTIDTASDYSGIERYLILQK